MFLATQLIGIAVLHIYNTPIQKQLYNETTGQIENVTSLPSIPYGMQPPQMQMWEAISSIIFSIFLATALILLIRKFKWISIMRLWFFSVVILTVAITINAFLIKIPFLGEPVYLLALVIALPLAFAKVYERNIIIHNATELLVYPGIASFLVPMLNIWGAMLILALIAVYDVYAVWHAKFMQKMAKFQIEQMKVFTGLFLPYVAKKDRVRIQNIKTANLTENKKMAKLKKLKIKVNLAILGGGDIAFPLVFAGVLLRDYGVIPALIIALISTLTLAFLFLLAKKGRFYPAMLFLSPACIIGFFIEKLFHLV
ncbi:MAG: presenilin family intramembrane aspartyl protease [archaeon]